MEEMNLHDKVHMDQNLQTWKENKKWQPVEVASQIKKESLSVINNIDQWIILKTEFKNNNLINFI